MDGVSSSFEPKESIAVVFPVYNDQGTVRRMAEKARTVLRKVATRYKIVIVDDGSPDRSGEIADQLAKEYPEVLALHHSPGRGYGSALQTGLRHAKDFDWVCLTDGDDQYDLRELYHICELFPRYDMIITFRYCKIYSTWRMFLSAVYNGLVRWIFRSPFRDVSCGMKFLRASVANQITISSTSPFIGAELTLRAMLKGFHIGEVGINTYPRDFGVSTSTSWPNIIATIRDMLRFRGEVFNNRPREYLDK